MTKINDVKRSELANTLSLHDFGNGTYDLKGWAKFTVDLFQEYGLKSTRMGISAPTIKSTKMHTYIREVKKLDTVDSATITGITLQATINGSDNSHGDEIFHACFNVGLGANITTCVITLDNALAPLNSHLWNKITQQMAIFFQPRYGYGFQRIYKRGPKWYPFGVSTLEYGDPEGEQICCWKNSYIMQNGKYHTGDMRDIYPLNVLSSAHNQRMVDGMALFDWINADTSRGILTKLDADLWSWWVKDEEINSVRAALKPTGILLCAP